MKKFTFSVEETQHYISEMTVEAENEEQAKELIMAQLEDNPLEQQKDTFNGTSVALTFKGV